MRKPSRPIKIPDLYEKGDYEGAVSAYQRLIAEFPAGVHRLEAYLGLANAYYLLKKYAEAVSSFKFLLDHRQPDSEAELVEKATLGYAWASIRNNAIEEGIKYFHIVVDRADSKEAKINAYVQMADASQDVGRFKEAVGIYDDVMKNYPDNIWADYILYRQAIAYLKLDQLQASFNSFEHLKNSFPN